MGPFEYIGLAFYEKVLNYRGGGGVGSIKMNIQLEMKTL